MLQSHVEEELPRDEEAGFVLPDYDGYCLSNVPNTILSLFDVERDRPVLPDTVFENVDTDVDTVILLLIDGLGYRSWQTYAEKYVLFEKITAEGTVTPLTSIFPSTTSAALTTVSTGETPQEHGLPGWTIYFEELDTTIQTLPFLTLDYEPVTDRYPDATPDLLHSGTPIYLDLEDHNVSSYHFLAEDNIETAYTEHTYPLCHLVGYHNFVDLAVHFRHTINEADGENYFYPYVTEVDAFAHHYAPRTDEHEAQAAAVSDVFHREIQHIDEDVAENTLLLVAADHGQVSVNPEETIDLLQYPEVKENLARMENGDIIYPTGSARNVYLHVQEGEIETVYTFLQQELAEKAEVWRMDEAVEHGLFGRGDVHPRFRSRVGDILITPYNGYTVWYEADDDEKAKEFSFHGHHGGLSPEEMLVPFAAVNLADLQS